MVKSSSETKNILATGLSNFQEDRIQFQVLQSMDRQIPVQKETTYLPIITRSRAIHIPSVQREVAMNSKNLDIG